MFKQLIDYAIEALPELIKGIPYTLSIAIVAFFFGSIIGLVLAYCRINNIKVISNFAKIYISFVRGTPLLVQIFIGYYSIPIAIQYVFPNSSIASVPAIYFVYISFSLNVAAYLSEIFRSAILSVSRGQIEAAYSIGMTPVQTVKKVILPQALVSALPNLSNMFLILLKDTSLAFSVTVPEIIGQAQTVAGRTSRFLEVYILAALIYWVICVGLEKIFYKLENSFTKYQRGGLIDKGEKFNETISRE
ncbi:amino acid ABC transporter permease [Loigolactobacillus backii]|uniref:amino acid ABC transporter permease n=1 Tax=Loigolactobacillus backii TaxID=375175 RepID=UPI000C1CAEE9|nr:amino acid ABC transporter permease [Loigolactobacillus backii]MDA5388949.1 amino acid ABC transporter permease [Loigolactobacillus backii]MDA5391456.1 amino acid ABC transporter permease [Loigolactobacillus backii]PIO82639.1 ABC transporter permease [Loigolactobacillus backii]